jgi:hypothetical protein
MANFAEFVHMCAEERTLLQEFDRLHGTNLAMRGTRLDVAIDAASGRLEHDARLFYEFCKDIWGRIPKEG